MTQRIQGFFFCLFFCKHFKRVSSKCYSIFLKSKESILISLCVSGLSFLQTDTRRRRSFISGSGVLSRSETSAPGDCISSPSWVSGTSRISSAPFQVIISIILTHTHHYCNTHSLSASKRKGEARWSEIMFEEKIYGKRREFSLSLYLMQNPQNPGSTLCVHVLSSRGSFCPFLVASRHIRFAH